MLNKGLEKYIRSLKDKKNRDHYNTFVVEGNKMVKELLTILPCEYLIITKELSNNLNIKSVDKIIEVKDQDIRRISFLKNPQQMLAVFFQDKDLNFNNLDKKLTLVLDEIQDPGNLGTIMRLADWYGIENIICSPNTVDIYNPKTVQASMGAIARVKVHYCNLNDFLNKYKHIPIYGTFLDGENIYQHELTRNGIIIMGNEGNGIREEVGKYVNKRLFIPSYPSDKETSESLNVAIATAITCAEFRRRLL